VLALPLPPLEEQDRLIAQLSSERLRIDSLVARVKDHIRLLREYRSALISAAVTGKIDVRDEVAA
jgi:restriction endonuclease S subunit